MKHFSDGVVMKIRRDSTTMGELVTMRGKVTVMTNKGDTMSKRNAKDNPWGPVKDSFLQLAILTVVFFAIVTWVS